MTTNRISRFLPWLAGSLTVAGVILALANADVPAQTKTTDTKSKTADTKAKDDTKAKKDKTAKKEAKLEPPPANFPKRIDQLDTSRGGADQVSYIDEHIVKGWKANSTYPSERCTDYEFIRRASLDVIGRIPTVKEIGVFMKHPEKYRRSWLINAMLDGKEYGNGTEYAQNFANSWTVHLMTRFGSGKHYQAQMNDWLSGEFKGESEKAPDWSKTAFELIAGKGRTNTNNAVNYLLHNLGEEIKQDGSKNGKWDMVPATSRTTRLFLGIRTQCVQCHDHPFNGEWNQVHFWGINAFFRQVDTNGARPTMMAGKKKKKGEAGAVEYDVSDNLGFNVPSKAGDVPLIPYERRNTVLLYTDPTYLSGKKIPKDFKGTRREALATLIINDPSFAKAFINRTWGRFFGKSFTKDNVDDFGDHNPVSHPELLDKLAEDWSKNYKHNPKELIRWICNSQAYGLSSRANKWNDKTEDETLFARMLLKPMSPEQMFDSVMIATQANLKEDEKLKWIGMLVTNFGNDEGEEAYSGTVIQALLLMNSQDINKVIASDKDGALAAIIRKRGGTASYKMLPFAVNDMFLQVLGRPATDKERFDIASPKVYLFSGRSKTGPESPQFWHNYYQDVFWALLNSNEFVLNH